MDRLNQLMEVDRDIQTGWCCLLEIFCTATLADKRGEKIAVWLL